MRVLARRTENVWLLTEDPTDPPTRVRVLDLSLGRLFPSHDALSVMASGDWKTLTKEERPDVDELLRNVDVMPEDLTPFGPSIVGVGH